ncbi:carbohydrate ABC transporter permease [Paenibacillus thalictri]|uniref:Carbohydrate ABC transporter permease n=1 Tax=Paenibacillus thalictri TaxID=2527873 RepID=A0A4Q9DHV2_9BACL|nr:carbohydrate ABC transporter permease [Paenibacillus thalictri]TBL71103.1 carbohydrate ABC transporter permease [Paenibacillus thalictri]
MRHSTGEKWFYSLNYVLLLLLGIGTVVPFLYIAAVSLTPLTEVMRHGGFILFPTQITFAAYEQIFTESLIPRSLLNTVIVTLLGTLFGLLLTMAMGFGLARKEVPGRRIYIFLVVFTILFNGGIIPTYLVVKNLGLINSLLALFVPTLISPFHLLIAKTFMEQLPGELEDAAVIDGAGEAGYFVRVVLPLSLPLLATLGLFNAVYYWNLYFPGLLYITKADLFPLQVALQQLVTVPEPAVAAEAVALPPETMKMAGVVVSTLPIVIVYPFLQKYFVKGATLGAVKG